MKKEKRIKLIVCFTNQHVDLFDSVNNDLKIVPDVELKIKFGDLTNTFLEIFKGMDIVLNRYQPHLVVVQGDTTTVLATSLVSWMKEVPIAHVEAGMRTFNRQNPFPEEVSRVVTDYLSDLHFAPTYNEVSNLEMLQGGTGVKVRTVETGNTIIDSLKKVVGKRKYRRGRTILVTIHRREGQKDELWEVCNAFKELSRTEKIKVVLHKNPVTRLITVKLLGKTENITLVEPMGYREMVSELLKCKVLMTDSGGLVEEATYLGIPTLVLRRETDRPTACQVGIAKMAEFNNLFNDMKTFIKTHRIIKSKSKLVFGDGASSKRIVKEILKFSNE